MCTHFIDSRHKKYDSGYTEVHAYMHAHTEHTHSPSVNFCSSSVLPMALAAWHICLINSSSLLMHRMTLPSNASVILQICEKGAPCVHKFTTSIKCGLND